jgi:Cu/Ag efflux protein CusF
VTGLVVKIDPAHRELIVSCQEVPGRMAAMAMPFQVRDSKALQNLHPGVKIRFNALDDRDKVLADDIEILPF